MKDFTNDAQTIRQFLLGQLTESETGKVEDRIFEEPDFAEEVQIIEDEMIADYRSGKLSPEERHNFSAKYASSSISQSAGEFDAVFNEFIRSQHAKDESMTDGNLEQRHAVRERVEESHSFALRPESENGSSLYAWISAHRTATFATVFALLLLTFGFWYLAGHRSISPAVDNPTLAERRAKETELARLNTKTALSSYKDALAVDLAPVARSKGIMARIPLDEGKGDRLIEFRLNLEQDRGQPYRAIFFDDRHVELFSIAGLTAEETPNGPEVRLVVPAKFLKRGDYQIELSSGDRNGGNQEINSYAFRVLESKP